MAGENFGGFPSGETPPDQKLGERDETKDKVDETKIEKGQETELTEEEKKELEEKREKALASIGSAEEKLGQEAEKLPEEKRKIFEGFAGKAKETLKAVGKFIKDYSSTGGLATVAAVSAWVARYFTTCPELSGGNDIVLATMTGVYSGGMAVGAFVEGVRATYRRKEKKEEKMKA